MSTSRDRPVSVREGRSGLPAFAPAGGRIDDGGTTTLITDLPYGPEVAEVARGAIALALHGAADADLVDDARLIGSELATNAFACGSPPLVLCVDRRSTTAGDLEVEVTVTDGGCSPQARPSPAARAEEAESGRGLVIVKALADTWSLTTGSHGTRAWCRLSRALSLPAATR